ncbi:MAG: 4Fe-4S dicluster domain-containing protein [Gracilibacteraceae bacterium]|nr:4Fe-4S dicluster domain-containing protein [Gracilibacteraceae bacterium]
MSGALTFGALRPVEARTGEFRPDERALTAERWGLVIDVDKYNRLAGREKIAAACHRAHNVPAMPETKTEIKWIWEDDFAHSFAEMENPYLSDRIEEMRFPVLCNHCEEPACVKVCPTKATFQRPDGIVNMDYHRCIGCRFCMAGCPFGARSFNFFDPRPYIAEVEPNYPTRTGGVVEKCTFCVERLAAGLPPHCVEAAEGAIIFGDLNDPASAARKALAAGFAIRRKVELGTGPCVYYLLGGGDGDA